MLFAELFLLLLLLLRSLCLGTCSLCRHVTGPDDVVITHACRSPCECGRKENGEEKIFWAEDSLAVDKEH